MIQTGMMWPVFVEDEPYMDRILDFAIGYAVYAGPKITGNLTFDALKGGGDLYAALNKSKLTGSYFTIDAEASVKYRAWRGHTVEKKYPQSLSMYSIDYNLFPEISNMTYEVTGNEMNEIKAHFYTKGDTFWPQYLGVALYAKANDNDEKYTKLYKNALKYETCHLLNNYNDAEVEIRSIDAGDYKLRPVYFLKGFDVFIPIYDMEQDVHIGRTDLLLQPDKLTVEEEGGEFTIGLKTGHPLPVEVMPNMDWATAKVNYVDDANGRWARSITVTVDPNGDNGRVSITLGGNYTFSDIQVSKADQEWLTVEQHSDYFIINAMPNTSDQERETTITLVFKKVKSSLPGPETYKVSFKIKQKAAIAKVDKDRLHFFGNGGSDQVKIDFGIYPYCGAYVSGKADPEDHEMVKMPVAIVQDGSTIIPDGDNSPFKMVNFWMTRKIDYGVNSMSDYDEYDPDGFSGQRASYPTGQGLAKFAPEFLGRKWNRDSQGHVDEYLFTPSDEALEWRVDINLWQYPKDADNDYEKDHQDFEWVAKFPNQSIINTLKEKGMVINTGSNPPALEGTFTLEPLQVISQMGYDYLENSGRINNLLNFNAEHVKFSGLSGNTIMFDIGEYYKNPFHEGPYPVAIKGSGNKFTISYIRKFWSSWNMYIYSGEVDGSTLKNVYAAAVAIEDDFTFDHCYIYKDSDGVSEAVDW